MNEENLNILRAIVVSASRSEEPPENVTLETPLLDQGLGLDSFAIVDLVMGVERQFGVRFREEDFVVENFASIQAIAALIDRSQPIS